MITGDFCPVGWVCRIHRLHLCRGVRPLHQCPGYETKQSDGEVPVMLEILGSAEHLFIAIAPRSNLARNGNTLLGPIYSLNRTNCLFMLK